MAALRVVGRRTAPVLGEEEGQPVAGAGQVRLRVERPEDRVDRDAVVEPTDQRLEERHPAGGVVEAGLVGHPASLRGTGRRLARRPGGRGGPRSLLQGATDQVAAAAAGQHPGAAPGPAGQRPSPAKLGPKTTRRRSIGVSRARTGIRPAAIPSRA